MSMRSRLVLVLLLFASTLAFSSDQIPKVAWHRPIGQPLENPGGKKPQIQGMIDDGYWQGAPVGGFGAGTFSLTYRGDFERWHLKTGVHKYENVRTDHFSVFVQEEGGKPYAQVLSTDKPSEGPLSAWNWGYPVGAGEYAALYPKSWFRYELPQQPVKLTVEQYSPILPQNYKESSYPVAVYNWYAENTGEKTVTVSIMLTWANMTGWLRDQSRDFRNADNLQNTNRFRSQQIAGLGNVKAVILDRIRPGSVEEEWDGQFALAALESPGVQVSYLTTFPAFTDGSEVWKPFSSSGTLPNLAADYASSGEPLAGAIAVKFTLKPHERRSVPIVLAWDYPIVQFGGGRKWLRRYTDFFGAEGTHAFEIAAEGLKNSQKWSEEIDAWQKPYIENENKPDWYRGELFNELYILADGGTLWGRQRKAGEGRPTANDYKNQSFTFMECFDYPFYGTLDVRFYGSVPLALFWPELDKMAMREFGSTIDQEIPWKYVWLWKAQEEHQIEFRQRKVKGALPHDLGVPAEDPVVLVNQFSWQNTNRWKDLNSKFVLLIWRDFVLDGSKDLAFLKENYAGVKSALEYLRQFDKDGDGMIENEGYPDQTYDTWVTRGESAYSGGLYLASLRAAEEMAKKLGVQQDAAGYRALFSRAQQSYIKKLWNGSYFNYDLGSPYHDNVMTDQLAGQWYANMTGLGDIVPKEMRVSAMKKVFDFNVMKYANGEMGALNGMGSDGSILKDNEQIQEVWTGTTFAAAAEMLAEGLPEQAYKTAKGVYNVVYVTKGYWFRTPEAWGVDGMYRASMYMRPASIWAMEIPHGKLQEGQPGK